MKILTLDLSTKSSGYAIGTQKNLQQHGCLTESSKDVFKRILNMVNQICEIIKSHNIDKIIMQQVLPQYNQHTSKVLLWLQGILLIQLHEINPSIQYEFIQPNKWRAAIKIKQGRGIRREQVKQYDIQYVRNKYNIEVNDDQADAICIFDAYWEQQDNEINWE